MYKIFFISIAIMLSACNVTTGNTNFVTQSTPDTKLAKDFFTEEVKQCGASNITEKNVMFVDDLIGISPLELYSSNSLTVKWNYVGDRVLRLLDMTYKVASDKDARGAKVLIGFMEEAARTELMYDWENWNDIAGKTCWKGPDSKCAYHHPEFASQFISGMLISAVILEEYIEPNQRIVLDKYFAKMYKRFIKPQAFNQWSTGFYAGANGGVGNLAYARWTNDQRLFAKEIKYRTKIIRKHFRKDGWIENNSWRGNRDYWYHTLGLDTVLGYMVIARANGYDLFADQDINSRISASIDKTVLGNKSLVEFSKKGYKGKNHITGKKDARPHLHQEAINLVQFMKKEYNVHITPRQEHFYRQGDQENVSMTVGFNASCYYKSK